MRKKILVTTGTRADYGILRSTIDAIATHPKLELRLLVTGMHTQKKYGDTLHEIKTDGYHIDAIVSIPESTDMLGSLAKEIEGMRDYCARERPDCMLVLGDRGEMLAAAIVAAHLNIPLAHIHGGDKTGTGVDYRNRNAITKFATIHFPGTAASAERLRMMGVEGSRIFEVGTPSIDMIESEPLLSRQEISNELQLDANREWLAVVMHPVSFDKTPLEKQIGSVLEALDSFPKHEKIILYPNSDTGTEVFINAIRSSSLPYSHVKESLPRRTYVSLVKGCVALIGNSSAGIIETAHLGTPSVDIGPRQDGRERGTSVLHAEYDAKKIADTINAAIDMKRKNKGPFPSPYSNPGAGARIADVLARELERPQLLNKHATP